MHFRRLHHAPRRDLLAEDRAFSVFLRRIVSWSVFFSAYFNTLGNHMTRPGIYVMTIWTTTRTTTKLMMALESFVIDTLEMLEATNRSTPTGGVMHPMARFVVMITPKNTGSIPSLTAIGTKIGVRMVIAAEAFLLSGNAPIQTISLRGLERWRALEDAPGAVLELPLARGGLQAPLVGLHARYHRQAIVNPTLLPREAPVSSRRSRQEKSA